MCAKPVVQIKNPNAGSDVELGSPWIAAKGVASACQASAAYMPPITVPGSPMQTLSEWEDWGGEGKLDMRRRKKTGREM
jgi:hypothetical protein